MSEVAFYLNSHDSSFLLNLVTYYLTVDCFAKPKGHCHHVLELNYIKSGKGKYYVDDRVYDVCEGDLFVFNNIEFHDLIIHPDGQLVNMVIHFEPQFIWSQENDAFDYRYLKIFYERNDKFENRLDRNNPATEKIKKLFNEMEQEFMNEQPGYDLMAKVKLLTILALILRHFGCVNESDEISNVSKQDLSCMKNVMYFIDNNLAEDISLEDMATVAHMNYSYFSTLFKKYNGIGLNEYISRKRISRAVDFLLKSDKAIIEIANLCGFNNISNFYRTFKKVTGQTPSDYR